ncbi:protein stichel-like 1 [Phtheirospermum japonicum]|uniref:Protein stichel-like 1 n=1 Tax=Phtheirospermum japonicum TaxID=374723 RepID=A0A830B609_9LAMI|nr:protein stichel-like 1 [Phtheirospermum japonicum]
MASVDDHRHAAAADPSNLHLKKELTQIRKAARGVLKDPGTSSSSSRRPPLCSSTSLTKSHLKNDQINGNNNALSSSSDRYSNNGNIITKENEKIVFLHNWRDKKPDIGEDDVENDGSSFNRAVSLNYADSSTSVSNGCINDSRSDGCLGKGTNFSPSIRNRSITKKPKMSTYSSASSRNHKEKLQILLSRYTKSLTACSAGSSLADETDYYCNSDDLLVRLKNNYSIRNPSTVESWDDMSFNNDEVDSRLGCGVPCYWSRRSTPKSRTGSCCSPSLSDIMIPRKKRSNSKTNDQSLVPLLTSEDELSTNFGELDLEGLSRLDGKMWSSGSPENTSSLSHKYRPVFFEELIGQNIVVKALTSAVSRKRVAPIYLFHGPRGVGKTSTARIFAAALNCLAKDEVKPCGVCSVCDDYVSGRSGCILEVDGSNKRGIQTVKNILKNNIPAMSRFKVFVVDECHLLTSRTWLAFLRLLEKPLLSRVVFILITTDVDGIPSAVLSRCQKHFFNKISNCDIVSRLRRISVDEGLGVELSALELIASNADGSLRDAEIMLDQLSLFGKKITKSLVNELIGVVSDEKLVELLELAMSSNATETVIRARELMDSGVDPIVLMSQLVTLIVDVIAGTYSSVDVKDNGSFVIQRNLTEREVDRLKHALAVLSEAEKHLKFSSERSTWFTATLLQLGRSTSSRRHSSYASEEDSQSSTPEKAKSLSKEKPVLLTNVANFDSKLNQSEFVDGKSSVDSRVDCESGSTTLTRKESKMLIDIWLKCIEKCHSKTLRQLLTSYGKLVSLSETKGGFVAHVAFEDGNIKTRAENFLSSITNSFEIVLQTNVDVKLIIPQDSPGQNPTHENISMRSNKTKSYSDLDSHQDSSSTSTPKNGKSDVPLRRIESIIHEQRLETAWLQAMDKNTPGSMSLSKPERNQVLPQEGVDRPNELEDELIHEIEAAEQGAATGGSKSGRFSWFGECAKASRHTKN